MSKKVWQYGRTGGKYIGEWPDEVALQVPYTNIPPLESIDLNDQFFIPSENRWKELVNQLDREALDNLNTLYTAIEDKNTDLVEKQKEQENQLTETQMALAEVYEMLVPADKEMNND